MAAGLIAFGLLLSRGRFRTLSGAIRSTMLAAMVLCLPLVARLPRMGGAVADGSGWLRFVPPAAIIAVRSLLAYVLRRRRLTIFAVTPLIFEDEMPDQLQQLGL